MKPLQISTMAVSLQWRHNEHDGVSNHQPRDCLLNHLFRRNQRKNQTPRHWPLCGEFTGDRWIPRLKGGNAEKGSTWWRHHVATDHSMIILILLKHLNMLSATWQPFYSRILALIYHRFLLATALHSLWSLIIFTGFILSCVKKLFNAYNIYIFLL